MNQDFILERKTGDSASVDPFIVLDTLASKLSNHLKTLHFQKPQLIAIRVKAFNDLLGVRL